MCLQNKQLFLKIVINSILDFFTKEDREHFFENLNTRILTIVNMKTILTALNEQKDQRLKNIGPSLVRKDGGGGAVAEMLRSCRHEN